MESSVSKVVAKKQRFVSEAENYCQQDDLESLGSFSVSDDTDRSTPPLALLKDNQNSTSTFWRPWNGSRKPFQCRTCNSTRKTFKRDPELRRHMRTTHMNQIEKCSVCFQEFTRKDNLTRHMKTKHNTKAKPSCKFCFKQLSRKDAVHRHESTCQLNCEGLPRISFYDPQPPKHEHLQIDTYK